MFGLGVWRRRFALLALLVAGVLAAWVVPVLGASSSPWDVAPAPIPDMSTWSQDPVWQQARVHADAVDAAQRQAAASPSADAEQLRSETQFGDLSPSESQELAQQTFPDLMTAPVDALGLPAGDRVTSYLSATTARVDTPAGKHLLLESTEPFAVKDDDSSRLSKVDLSLSHDDGALVADNPVVDVRLPDSAADPLTLPGSGLSVTMVDGTDVTGRVQNDRVFYGEVDTDTDYVTVPERQGAQVMWQLRSPQAPETLALDLDLPAGEHARLTSALTGAGSDENPSVQIVNDDDTVVDTIAAPSATNATGATVPARYRLDGDRLYVDVPHREQQATYPILVDPEVREVWGGSDWSNMGAGPYSVMAGQWGFTATEGTLGNPWYIANNASPTGYGMAIESWPGSYLYTAGAGAYDSWSAPANANISSVWFDGIYHRTEGDHLFAGTIGPSGWQTVYDLVGDTDYDQSSQSPPTPDAASTVVFGVFEDMTTTHPVPGWVALRGINVLVGDTRRPTSSLANISVNGATMPWARRDTNPDGSNHWIAPWLSTAGTTVTVNPVANDPGLGLQHLGVFTMDNNWIGVPWASGCSGNRSSPCPLNVNGYVQNLPLARGYTDMRTAALDVYGNVGYGDTWQMRVDGDSPKIDLGGDVYNHRTDGTVGYNPTIAISARDDSTSSIGGAYNQSGVSQVVVSLDSANNHIYTWSRPSGCNDDCDASFSLTLPVTTPGAHRLWVVATDGTNHYGNYSDPDNSGYLTFTVRNDISWTYGGDNHAIDAPTEMETVGQMLATSASYQAIWNGLSTGDKNTMMEGSDPYFSTWARRIDTAAPTAGSGLGVNEFDPTARTADVSWEEGADPDISTGVIGSQVATAEERHRESSGSWSAWVSADWGMTLTNADPGDLFYVQVRERDAAGNLSASRDLSVRIPGGALAHSSFLPLICVALCPELGELIIDGVTYEVVEAAATTAVRVTVRKGASAFERWGLRRLSRSGGRKALRTSLRNASKNGTGKVAHHIVAWGGKTAERAQEILSWCGVDPNEAANGVFLTAAQHKRTLTKAYYENVNRLLEQYWLDCGGGGSGLPGGKKPIREFLQDIGTALAHDNPIFPG